MMTEEKKQEVQKTVVAFAAGLLIGGLLVWVFSAAPSEEGHMHTDEEMHEDATEMVDEGMGNDAAPVQLLETNTAVPETTVTSKGSLVVENQSAGIEVVIASVAYPMNAGWIVVHEDSNGVRSNALGAARFDVTGGLTPESVRLLRETMAGETYYVVFYTENGDKVFNLGNDVPVVVEGSTLQTTFVAQ